MTLLPTFVSFFTNKLQLNQLYWLREQLFPIKTKINFTHDDRLDFELEQPNWDSPLCDVILPRFDPNMASNSRNFFNNKLNRYRYKIVHIVRIHY